MPCITLALYVKVNFVSITYGNSCYSYYLAELESSAYLGYVHNILTLLIPASHEQHPRVHGDYGSHLGPIFNLWDVPPGLPAIATGSPQRSDLLQLRPSGSELSRRLFRRLYR